MSTEVFFIRREQSGREMQTDVGGVKEGIGRWWGAKVAFGSP